MNWGSYVVGTITGLILAVLVCWADWKSNKPPETKTEPVRLNCTYPVLPGYEVIDLLYQPHSEIFISAKGYDNNQRYSTESLDRTYPWPVRVLIVKDP